MNLSFLDLLFPKRCVSCGSLGAYICKNCFKKIVFIDNPVCPICQRQAIGGRTHPGCAGRLRLDGLVVACRYRGPVKAAIQKVKYRWVTDIGATLVDFLKDSFWKFDLPSDLILIPVPLYPARLRWRGFNQAQLLTGLLSKKFGSETRDVLGRVRQTETQVGLDKKERHKNVAGAFSLRGQAISGKNLMLVDDVYTSGATMAQCAKVLKRAGAKTVWACAVALG